MAGDWIKMRGNLWDDPRVAALVDMTDTSEAAVVGALYWLWATADQHTEDGLMPGLTLRQIDRKTGVQGIGKALCDIGWLAETSDGVCLQNFTEHNGASAKRRATEAQRKANTRKVSASVADNIGTDLGQSEDENRQVAELEKEKRREELIQEEANASLSTSSSETEQRSLDGVLGPLSCEAPTWRVPPCPYEALLDLYDLHCPTMPRARRAGFADSKRGKAMRARWAWVLTENQEFGEHIGERMATTKEEGVEWFEKFFVHVAASDFLTGRNGAWTGCDIEFLMTQSRFISVLEGKYHREFVHAE
ncbi:hypothetical protein G7047_14650 [Diaphorobacter sp. HDW4A]|uniref:hypothetical protein n=1 Tax=Diaphorobacter sp. HDW4A TaxID=2714924 RepID=UPI00140A5BAD|nr:hypothetical protein [Diaphorobacter sp. HDW4A]QIL80997.1 hypothetical protein G7047_14650 [Diaphorobacter sp. HDW4A]